MGHGDALIAAGQAQTFYDSDPTWGPIVMLDGDQGPRWNAVWAGNPAIWVPGSSRLAHRHLKTGRGYLPYLRYPYSTATGWRFTDYRVRDHRPRLYLTSTEMALGDHLVDLLGRYVILEPTALRKHVNRRPARAFWELLRLQLKATLQNAPIVQLIHAEAEYLRGTIPAVHHDFRSACGLLDGAALLITSEGGLAHAAAALHVPAVVLWGGNIACDNLGYPEHVNIVDPSPMTPCGRLVACDHCAAGWAALDPVAVALLAAKVYTDGLTRSRR